MKDVKDEGEMQRTTFLVYTQKVIKIHLAALLEGFENRKLDSLYPKINGLFLRIVIKIVLYGILRNTATNIWALFYILNIN